MKSRTTLILVLIALVIGGLVALDHYKGTPTDEATAKRKKLLDIERADITHVELVRTNETIVLDKVGNDWEIKQPIATPADHSAVSGILDELQFAQRTRTLSSPDQAGLNQTEIGLNPPRLVLKLSGKKGPATLRVGGPTPTGNSVYVQVEGQKEIALTESSVAQRLDRSLNDLRQRTVLEVSAATATRVELKAAGQVVELAKSAGTTNAEPQWALVQPLSARADQTRASELLNDLNGLRIADFISDDPKDLRTHKLDEPVRELTVWKSASDLGSTLLIGPSPSNDTAKVLAKLKGRDSIFTLPADAVHKLDVAVNDLRDRAVVVFDTEAVRGLEVQRGTDRLSVERQEAGWKLTAPVQRAADPDEVDNLLASLEQLEAKEFVADVPTDLEPYGLTVPSVIISLKGEGTNVLASLLFGSVSATNGLQYAKLAGEPFVYGVETNLAEWLPAGPLPLFARRLAELNSDQITRLVIEQAGGAGKLVVERDPDKNWRLVEPSTGALDADGLRAVADAFAGLRAEEFVTGTPEKLTECGLDKPALTVTATTADKNYVLKIGFTQNADTYCAWWNDPESVFTISAASFQTLKKEILQSATLPPAPPAETNQPPAAAPAS